MLAQGYREALLDVRQSMAPAVALYRNAGFVEIPLYWANPLPDALGFGKRL